MTPTSRAASRRPRAFHVAFYVPSIGPRLAMGRTSGGGAETQILMLAGQLVARGWRVAIVSYATDPPPPEWVNGVRVLVHRPFRREERIARRIEYVAEVTRMLASIDAQVLVQRAAGSTTALVGLAARARRLRFVFSSANVLDFRFERVERDRRIVMLYDFGIRLADTVVVQTHEQVQLCRARFGRDPVLIPSLAEPAPPRNAVPTGFLWVGRLDGYKHPEEFVELARDVPGALFRMVAVAAGTPAGQERLAALRETARGVPNLELLEPRPHENLLALMDDAVAIVNTSDLEGMPNVFLEGWARGVPALALTHDPDGVIAREGLGYAARGSRERLAQLARDLWDQRFDQTE